MRTLKLSRVVGIGMVALLLLAVPSGCATRKIDWNARVGNYSFDQAVIELGPPAKQAKLTDGTTVAEWQTHRGYPQTYFTPGFGYSGRYHASYYSAPITTWSPDTYLRLTFDSTGNLASWKKISL